MGQSALIGLRTALRRVVAVSLPIKIFATGISGDWDPTTNRLLNFPFVETSSASEADVMVTGVIVEGLGPSNILLRGSRRSTKELWQADQIVAGHR